MLTLELPMITEKDTKILHNIAYKDYEWDPGSRSIKRISMSIQNS